MKYQACIFDLDGTLADTLSSIASFGNGALNAFGFPAIPTEDYKLMVGNGADLLLRRMLAKVGAELSDSEFRSFRAEYDRLYESDPMRLVAAYPGLPALLKKAKAAGLKIGVLSNKPDNMTRFIVRELYGQLPDVVYGQREGVPRKPDPTAALNMAKELGVLPRAVLYLGDSGVDMETGRSAGFTPCGVLWGFRSREELLSHGAELLAENAAELEKIILSA